MSGESILIIEDDEDLAQLLDINLSDHGYLIEKVYDGASGLERAMSGEHAMVVLDIMLPGTDGLEICRNLRSSGVTTPIMLLTARSDEVDKVVGLEMGADDYLTKPFSIRELIARVKAILRRVQIDTRPVGDEETDLKFGDLTIDTRKRRVSVGGKAVELTNKEFELLVLFARNPGRAYSRQELLDLVWGYHYGGYSHTVNSHINRLRRKIEESPSDPRFIKTVWGLGYRFAELEEVT